MILTAVEYIAQSINRRESTKKGYTHCTHWGTLDEKVKKRYLREAKSMVKEWAESENKAEQARLRLLNDLDKRV